MGGYGLNRLHIGDRRSLYRTLRSDYTLGLEVSRRQHNRLSQPDLEALIEEDSMGIRVTATVEHFNWQETALDRPTSDEPAAGTRNFPAPPSLRHSRVILRQPASPSY